jgi:hypothetical protein
MPRLIDSRLTEIQNRLLTLQKCVANLVGDAVGSVKNPGCGLGLDADQRDEEVIRLEKELLEEIAVTYARYAPVANDYHRLLAVLKTIPDLKQMGDCAKQICRLASKAGSSPCLLPLLSLTERMAGACSGALQRLETTQMQVGRLAAGRQEIEDVFEQALGDLAEMGAGELIAMELEHQALIAMDLRNICDAAARIMDEMVLFQTGNCVRPAA